jgi:hypothetical protein
MTHEEIVIASVVFIVIVMMFASNPTQKQSDREEQEMRARDAYWKAHIRQEKQRIENELAENK